MTVDWFDSAVIQYKSSSSREVLRRQRLWQRWSFRQYKCSRTIMLKEWPGCIDHLCSIRYVCYSCDLLVLSTRFLLCSTYDLADLPHLQKVEDHVHSVQFSSFHLSRQIWVVFWLRCIQCWVIPSQTPVIGLSKLPYNNLFGMGLAGSIWLPPAHIISPKGRTGLHSGTMWDDRDNIACHIGQIGILYVRFPLLAPPVGDIQYPKCITNLHWIRAVIIEIWINLPPVLWWFRQWIQIGPGAGQ